MTRIPAASAGAMLLLLVASPPPTDGLATFDIDDGGVRLVSPNGGETLYAGTVANVTWEGGSGFNSTLYFSNSSIVGPFVKLGENLTSPYGWEVPDDPTTSGYLKVEVRANSTLVGEDTSDSGFVIIPMKERQVALTHPRGNEHILNGSDVVITWTSGYPTEAQVSLDIAYDGLEGNYSTIASGIPNTGTFIWSANRSGDDCSIRVTISDEYGAASDHSDAPFHIYDPPSLTVTSPSANESVRTGSVYTVTWESRGGASILSIDIWLFMDVRGGPTLLVEGLMDPGRYEWSVPEMESNETYIEIIGVDMLGNSVDAFSGRFALTREGMLLGVITGFVHDENGPLRNVVISLYNYTFGANSSVPLRSTTTGYDGNYTFREVVPGDYLVVCETPGYETTARVVYVSGGGTGWANLTVRRVPGPSPDILVWTMLLLAVAFGSLAVWLFRRRGLPERFRRA